MTTRRLRTLRRALVPTLLLSLAWPACARAQRARERWVQPELRVDAIAPHPSVVQLGAGVNVPLGYYVRLGVMGAAGTVVDGAPGVSARGDAIVRFLLDPFRQSRWGVSAGGGVTVRHDRDEGTRPRLAVLLDVELPARGDWTPALQLGLGGGVRMGIGVRAARDGRR